MALWVAFCLCSLVIGSTKLNCISYGIQILPEMFNIVVVEDPPQFDLGILKSLTGLVVSSHSGAVTVH